MDLLLAVFIATGIIGSHFLSKGILLLAWKIPLKIFNILFGKEVK